jgi:hypothetical protein
LGGDFAFVVNHDNRAVLVGVLKVIGPDGQGQRRQQDKKEEGYEKKPVHGVGTLL